MNVSICDNVLWELDLEKKIKYLTKKVSCLNEEIEDLEKEIILLQAALMCVVGISLTSILFAVLFKFGISFYE